jgi:5-methyltetrahydrofolate--homocysteine methyltransferase
VRLPLLIGGATTSRTHTAVRIAPVASFPVVHVLDASRAVPVTGSLISADQRDAYAAGVRDEYEKVRSDYARRGDAKRYVPLEEARSRAEVLDPSMVAPAPRTPGVTVFDDVPLDELRPYIDWTPFFLSWEMRGRYPAILDDPTSGAEARTLFADANAILDRVIADRSIRAKAVCGIFPAYRDGDDVVVDGTTRLHFLRQQSAKAPNLPQQCLADYIATPEAYPNGTDHIGAFVVNTGIGVDALVAEFEARHDDYSAIMVKAVADRLAEACAEWLHARVRTTIWGYAPNESFTNEELISEAYHGIRPAPGYPACPDHTEKRTLFTMLDAERNAGVTLTDSYAMQPASAVSGWYFAHPQASYFGIQRITEDQVADYAARKGWTIEEAERWLSPLLPL